MTFLCMQRFEITLICFFSIDGRKKKRNWFLGMKVNNVHEFVKKINNAAFVGEVFCIFYFSMLRQQCPAKVLPLKTKTDEVLRVDSLCCSALNIPVV